MATDQDLRRLSARVGRRLLAAGARLTTAESCTGGWIARCITDIAGSSQWFDGGFVTYSNEAKRRDLGVPKTTLAREGAVSELTVRAMARGALDRTGVDVAVAVSGIAGPDGAVPGKPVGTVWFAVAQRRGKAIDVQARLRTFRGDREQVRRKAVQFGLKMLLGLEFIQ
jgi:nicotinamide-nucleotide amidase